MLNWLQVVIKREKKAVSQPGSRYKVIYSPKVQKDGSIELVEKSKTCLYDYIQSFKDSCDINVLIRRFQQGDTSALLSGNSFYGDVTEMPKTFADMLQVSLDCEQFFNKLPADEKAKFDNNFAKFISAFGSDEFLAALGIQKDVKDVVQESVQNVSDEVVENE